MRRPKIIEMRMEKDAISKLAYCAHTHNIIGFEAILELYKKETGIDLTENDIVKNMLSLMSPFFKLSLKQVGNKLSKETLRQISESNLERLMDQLVDFCANNDEVGFQTALYSIKESTGVDLSNHPEVQDMISKMSGDSKSTINQMPKTPTF